MLALLLAGSPTAWSQDLRNLDASPVVSTDQPFFMVLMSSGCWRTLKPELWHDVYPDSLKPYMAIEICNKPNHESKFKLATEQNIPVIYRVRSVWPIEQSEPMTLEFIESVLRDYPIVRGLAASELMNARFTKEERDYVVGLIELCEKYDRLFIWTEAAGGSLPLMQIATDDKLREAFEKSADRIIVIEEAVDGVLQVINVNTLLGLREAGIIENWGINPQFFYWRNSGFIGLDEQVGPRQGSREAMPASVYSQLMMHGAMLGGTGFFFGAERVPHYFDENFKGTETWHALVPFMEELTSGKVIPTKEEVAETFKIGITGGPDAVGEVSSEKAKSGQRSVSLVGALRQSAWTQENWTPIDPTKAYTVSGWSLFEKAAGNAKAQVEVVYFNRDANNEWPFISKEVFPISRTASSEWQSFEVTPTIPEDATDLVIVAAVEGDGGELGRYYFDDFSVRDENGKEHLINPSFEEMDDFVEQPIGWSLAFKKDLALTADFGLPGRFYDHVFDLNGHGDMFVESGKWGPIPLFPTGWEANETMRGKLIPLRQWDEQAIQDRLDQVEQGDSEGVRAQYPGRLWLSSSLENSSGIQAASGSVSGIEVEAQLPSASHLLAVQHDDNQIHLLVAGRKTMTTQVALHSDQPFTATRDGEVQSSESDGDSRQSLMLSIDHSKQITQKFILETPLSKAEATR